jgi:sugar (pentulose or hexulose) kinase
MQDTVIGIDLSTTTAKAIAWNAQGQAVAEGRAPLSLERPEPNAYEQHPDAWWRAVQTAPTASPPSP